MLHLAADVLVDYCYGDHRNLNSFPTRRSSDLFAGLKARTAIVAQQRYEQRVEAYLRLKDALPHAKRSEEHTSELQSRRELVCRLLLEKKKIVLYRHVQER